MDGKKLGFFGAGSMAQALIKGILGALTFPPEGIYVTNKNNEERLRFIEKNFSVRTTRDHQALLKECDVIIIAVKPRDINELLCNIKNYITRDHLVISVVAGVTTSMIEKLVGKNIKVIRAMPNTSCQVKESATAIATGRYAKPEDEEEAFRIFSSVGKVVKVDEQWMDAVTALSGSGPAYVYLMIEALTEAGVKAGLPNEIALNLSIQTVFGAAKMVVETGEMPENLRKKVMSPGGTTVAAIETLKKMGFGDSIIQAVKNAAHRSKELMTERENYNGN